MNIEIKYPRAARNYCSKYGIDAAATTERILGALDADSATVSVRYEEVQPPNRKYRLVAVTTQTHVDLVKHLLKLVEKEFRDEYPGYGAQVELPANGTN
ncbi:hypothetical protein MTO96_038877 [Rhipicephalus appendiculatus]